MVVSSIRMHANECLRFQRTANMQVMSSLGNNWQSIASIITSSADLHWDPDKQTRIYLILRRSQRFPSLKDNYIVMNPTSNVLENRFTLLWTAGGRVEVLSITCVALRATHESHLLARIPCTARVAHVRSYPVHCTSSDTACVYSCMVK